MTELFAFIEGHSVSRRRWFALLIGMIAFVSFSAVKRAVPPVALKRRAGAVGVVEPRALRTFCSIFVHNIDTAPTAERLRQAKRAIRRKLGTNVV